MSFPSNVFLPWFQKRGGVAGGGGGNFTAFAAPYGRRSTITTTASVAGTSATNASITLTSAYTITAADGAGTTANPAGYVDPAGFDWYAGTPATTVWAYFHQTASQLIPTTEGTSSQAVSAGNQWVNVTAANQTVQASTSATTSTLETTASCQANATYDVYVQESASQPTGGPAGTLLGTVRVESVAVRNYVT